MENCESPNRRNCPIYSFKCISGVSELFTNKCSHCRFMGSSRYPVYFLFGMMPSSIGYHVSVSRAAEGGREGIRVLTAKSHLLLGPWALVHGGLYGLNLFTRHWGQTAERFLSLMVSPPHCRRLCPTELLSAGPHGHK